MWEGVGNRPLGPAPKSEITDAVIRIRGRFTRALYQRRPGWQVFLLPRFFLALWGVRFRVGSPTVSCADSRLDFAILPRYQKVG